MGNSSLIGYEGLIPAGEGRKLLAASGICIGLL